MHIDETRGDDTSLRIDDSSCPRAAEVPDGRNPVIIDPDVCFEPGCPRTVYDMASAYQ